MAFQPQPSVRHARAREATNELIEELTGIADDHTVNGHHKAARDVQAMINLIVDGMTVRLKDR